MSDVKEKVMNLFPKNYKPKTIAGAFDDKYLEQKSEGDEQLPIREQLENITPYLCDMINNLKISADWKIHLAMRINFRLSEDINDKNLMHSKTKKK